MGRKAGTANKASKHASEHASEHAPDSRGPFTVAGVSYLDSKLHLLDCPACKNTFIFPVSSKHAVCPKCRYAAVVSKTATSTSTQGG